MKKTISITEFKAKCLSYMRDVDEKGMHIIITKHGKLIAEVQPVIQTKTGANPLKSAILMHKDILSPFDADWDVLND